MPLGQQQFARGVGYVCGSVLFGAVTLICEKTASEEPVMHVFTAMAMILTVNSVKNAWTAFRAALD